MGPDPEIGVNPVVKLYHSWSSALAQRVRLALGYKRVEYVDHPLAYGDNETFFELGVECKVPILQAHEGQLLNDSAEILWRSDELFPNDPPLVTGRVDLGAWQALLEWRSGIDALLARLYAPILPAYRDIGGEDVTLQAYKLEVRHRFGMSLEELANDRYAGYAQLEKLTRLKELSRHLAQARFYMGQPSAADLLLTADLYPLQLLDGITLPLDLMYYFARVQETCHVALNEGLLSTV